MIATALRQTAIAAATVKSEIHIEDSLVVLLSFARLLFCCRPPTRLPAIGSEKFCRAPGKMMLEVVIY